MTHAAFITPEFPENGFPSGGLATYVDRITRILAASGIRVTVIHPAAEPLDRMRHGVRNIGVVLPTSLPRRVLRNLFRIAGARNACFMLEMAHHLASTLRSLHEIEPVDIAQYASYRGVGLFRHPGIPAVVRISSLPVVYDGASGEAPDINARMLIQFERMALRRADLVIGPSGQVNAIARAWIGRDVDLVETPFLDTVAAPSRHAREKIATPRFLLFFGTVGRLKGVDRLGSIAETLAGQPDLSLVLAGKADEAGLAIIAGLKAKAGNAADRVLYLGELDHAGLRPLLTEAEAVLLPSRTDNLPNACIEAMAAGAIVIATRDASFEQLIDHGVSGCLVDQDDGTSLAAAAAAIHAFDKTTRSNMQMAAIARIAALAPEITGPKLIAAWGKAARLFSTRTAD